MSPATRPVPPAVRAVLARAVCGGQLLTLDEVLDRKTYEAVDAVLRDLGGRWDRKARAHVFPDDAAQRLAPLLRDGDYVSARANAYFPTPPALVEALVRLAGLEVGMGVLEPSAGQGAIADAIAGYLSYPPTVVELLPDNAAVLRAKGYEVVEGDFLAQTPAALGRFDRIVMNPPFDGGQDVRHVAHALGFLKPGGKLVAVMAAGILFRRDRAHLALRERLTTVTENPPASFRPSGTDAHTVTVTADAE